ncbi:MAG TPA: rod shape-determining protein [Nonomuraea sp.]|uniref:rod shape-determining protein n=1 Tax=Nonomuraea sp. NPDC049649 TaxID=3155776 RepID=UPI002BAA5FC8|nr:rod shape-determining protein [Nonomuraea sp.]
MTGNGVPWPDGKAAVDLGTARVRLAGPGRSVVEEAAAPPGGPRPVRHGLVADDAACARLLERLLRAASPGGSAMPGHVLIGVPVTASRAERARVAGIVRRAAGCAATVVEEPLAAALGSGLDITDSRPRLLMDVGAGIVETVVIRDAAVTEAVAVQLPGDGPDVLPGHVQDRLAETAAELLSRLPARLRPETRERGLTLTGGGAAAGLAGHLCSRLGMPVSRATEPAHATVRGLARLCLPPMAALVALPTA